MLAGVDVFRINMSHASHDVARDHYAVRTWRAACAGRSASVRPAGAEVPSSATSPAGASSSATARCSASIAARSRLHERVFLPHRRSSPASPGALLLDDGKTASVIEATRDCIAAEVVNGGALGSAGISLPDTLLPIGPLTEKDEGPRLRRRPRRRLDRASFVQRGEDVLDVRRRRRPGRDHGQDREAIR